ncbi:Transmembrane protein 258 [Trichinella nativa]|uniref:Dolichyl-diphosphooligosaccharide-protein glycosyltransferase subunit TMEM258 n=1 Tax=Trichinella nativa TaxID=6335 RepID=A0A0V1LK79_9BILA|nr:Transmembrane protein 258 [Trichinella nativa]
MTATCLIGFAKFEFNVKYQDEDLQILVVLFCAMDMKIESMNRYVAPINPAVYPPLAVTLLSIGLFFAAWFMVYEVTSSKFTRNLLKEILLALVASAFMGVGVLFLLLWVGIYNSTFAQ